VPVEPPIESPATLPDALGLLADTDPAWRPLAGGTDVLVAITGELGPPPARLLNVWRLDELRGIAIDGSSISLGALSTYTDIRRSPLCREHLPALVGAAATIGAAQIQNRGTIGGNIANASPAGDTLPVLLALDADVVVASVRGERRLPIGEFFVAYRRTALAPDELILRIVVPLATDREVRFRKVGTRRAQAISKVVMALAWRSTEGTVERMTQAATNGAHSGAGWSDVRLALGSVADRPIRAPRTEALLEGSVPTPETADRAADALAAEIRPIDDVRSTADYRRTVAARILHRLIRDAGGW
jgi:CO/xanthine dehydrogenase FAD-binding subunit